MKRKWSYIIGISILMGIVTGSIQAGQVQQTSNEVVRNQVANNVAKDKAQYGLTGANQKLVDYSDCFNDINGCAVIYHNGKYDIYQKDLAMKRVSPCSTFKIISTLMGIKNGLLTSLDTKMGYDTTKKYEFDAWNQDLGLKAAFNSSCVWYFKKVIEAVGKNEVKSEIKALKYGNCNINKWDGSGINQSDQDGFWIEASLKISPVEQVQILKNIFEGKTIYTKEQVNLLKEVMKSQISDNFEVYGKTGTGYSDNAWFVGMFEKNGEAYYFAVRLNDTTCEKFTKGGAVSGKTAKEVALKIIEKYYLTSDK